MKRLMYVLFISLSVAFITTNCKQSENSPVDEGATYDLLSENFPNPSGLARPKVYWWCLNGFIDTLKAREEFIAMKNAGITGFDLFEIGSRDKIIPAGPAFLGDESLNIIKFVVDEAGKHGLTVGLNLASSWNAGGSWIEAKNGGKSLYRSSTRISGNSEEQNIKVPFPEINFPKSALIGGTGKSLIPFRDDGRPEYYEEIAVLAVPSGIEKNSLDVSMVIDVSNYFNPESDELSWKAPEGEWEIYRFVCSNSGQQVVLPSPYSAGLTIDHFDSTAVRTHLTYIINRLKPVLGDFRNTALTSFYLASYEARGFVWSSTLPREFKKLHGYDINKYLPVFFDAELFDVETTKKIQRNFRKTLSEMMITNLYEKTREICNTHGLKINCEAGGPGYPLYNGPAEPLKALGALDIPRGEFWVNHSRYYLDDYINDSIDILRVVKEVSAASHIYKRGIVEMEAFTSFEHWMEGPFDIKWIGDRAFCEGMNRVAFHGFTHNPAGMGFPGIVYHAGTHMNNKRVWWPKINPFIDYLSRISYIFQKADFTADVVYYYGDRVPNVATPKNTRFKVGPGYDYEVINTEILLDDLSFENGKLTLSNGAEFSMLALDYEDVINPAVLVKLDQLARQGAVIAGKKPEKVGELFKHRYSGQNGEKLLNKLWTNMDDPSAFKPGTGKVISGMTPRQILAALDVPSDLDYPDKETFLIDYIHYQKDGVDFYFIRNTSDQWISRDCGFRQQSRVPEIWDPITGKIIPLPVYNEDGKYTRIPLTLAPYDSYLVVFRKGTATPQYSGIKYSGQHPPLLKYSNNGITFLDEGNYELLKTSGSFQFENKPIVRVIDGPWTVNFSKEWGAPESVILPQLISWTDHENPGIKYYSGMGKYQKTFTYEMNTPLSEEQRIFLDLGEMAEMAEVWLNGQSLGIVWAKPFKYDVTSFIKNGENVLTIEVANNWCNRIIGDAITGQEFTNTNIARVGRMTWDQVPLSVSGLLGPVTIQEMNLLK